MSNCSLSQEEYYSLAFHLTMIDLQIPSAPASKTGMGGGAAAASRNETMYNKSGEFVDEIVRTKITDAEDYRAALLAALVDAKKSDPSLVFDRAKLQVILPPLDRNRRNGAFRNCSNALFRREQCGKGYDDESSSDESSSDDDVEFDDDSLSKLLDMCFITYHEETLIIKAFFFFNHAIRARDNAALRMLLSYEPCRKTLLRPCMGVLWGYKLENAYDYRGSYIVLYAIGCGDLDAVLEIIGTDEGRQSMLLEGRLNDTPVNPLSVLSYNYRYFSCSNRGEIFFSTFKAILATEEGKQLLSRQNLQGQTPVHHWIKAMDFTKDTSMLECMEILELMLSTAQGRAALSVRDSGGRPPLGTLTPEQLVLVRQHTNLSAHLEQVAVLRAASASSSTAQRNVSSSGSASTAIGGAVSGDPAGAATIVSTNSSIAGAVGARERQEGAGRGR
jgi:hypothetical protein